MFTSVVIGQLTGWEGNSWEITWEDLLDL